MAENPCATGELTSQVSIDAEPTTPSLSRHGSSYISGSVEGCRDADQTSRNVQPKQKQKELKTDHYDGIVLYYDDDLEKALLFCEYVNNIKQDIGDDNVGVVLYDAPEVKPLGKQRLNHLGELVEKSKYVFVFLTKPFCDNIWHTFAAETCISNMLEDDAKRWSVIPVLTEKADTKNGSYKVPFSLSGLHGLTYYKRDKDLDDKLRKLFEPQTSKKADDLSETGKSEKTDAEHSKESTERTIKSFTFRTSQYRNRGLFLDTNGREEPVWVSKIKATIAESVCKIHTPFGTGTGFRVGSCYVMTANHVLKCLAPEQGNLSIGYCYALFNYLHETELNEKHKFFFKNLVYFNEYLDTAVLELEPHSETPMPPSFKYFSPPLHQDFFFIGHSKGEVMKINPVDKHIKLDENNITYLFKLQNRCFQTYGLDYDYDNSELKNVLNSDRTLFMCTFVHGASGSPGVFINDKDVVVTTMLLRGYPDWYYEDDKPLWSPDDCVEQGLNMESLYKDMKIKNPDLCWGIFHQTDKYMKVDLKPPLWFKIKERVQSLMPRK